MSDFSSLWHVWRRAFIIFSLGPLVQVCALAAHPSLFYSSTDIATLKSKKSDASYADIFNEIKIDCRSSSRYGPGSTVDTQDPERRYWEAIRSHAALLMLDPTLAADSDYQCATQFTKYYNAVLNAPGWSNFFDNDFLLSNYLLAGLIIGYDMNYASFSATARQDIITKLADRADYMIGQTDFLDIPDDLDDNDWGYQSTFKVLRNKFVMSFSTLGLIAYGLNGEVDATRRQNWLNTVYACLTTWQNKAMADGVSLESYSYHELMVELLFMFLEARTRVLGANQFLLYPAAAQHPVYSIYSWIPGGDRSFSAPIPWGDCDLAPPGDMRTNAAAMVRRLKGGTLDSSAQLAAWMQYRPLNGTANNSYTRVDPQHYFFIDSSVTKKSPTDLALPLFHYFPSSGMFVWRSGWHDLATYFAMTCAPQLGGHQAPEAGTFVIFKGGAPYIAPHYYLDNHLTRDHNVMLFEGAGQRGESSSSVTTEPQPPSQWPSFLHVLGDDLFFDVAVDLKNCYSSSKLTRYSREYVGFSNVIFVRDSAGASSSIAHENRLHAYKTTPPDTGDVLDIDSNPTANPWSGSNGSYTITPRSSGPFTSAMTVQDLSAKTWTRAISADTVKKHSQGDGQRGDKLVMNYTGSSATALMAFSFPNAGQSLVKWSGTDGEGVKFTESAQTAGVMVWPNNGTINGTSGLNLSGTMGGIYTTKGWLWGRELTKLVYNNVTYFTSTAGMSLFANTLLGTGTRIRVFAPRGGTMSLRCGQPVKQISLNGNILSSTQWSKSGNTINIPFTNMNDWAVVQVTYANAADPAWIEKMN